MIASAQAFRNGPRRASGERVCLLNRLGSIRCSGEGDHEGFLILTMHLLAARPAPRGLAALTGRVARPYANIVGATLVVALARTPIGPEQHETQGFKP